MKVSSSEQGDKKIFYVTGKVVGTDIVELGKMLEACRESEFDTIVVDLSDVSFIDSHGLGGLVYSHILLEKGGKKLLLAAPKGYAKALFRDCALDKVLKIVEPATVDGL
jgi:anti-anti-sigma factor